jgi:hypothetical protein
MNEHVPLIETPLYLIKFVTQDEELLYQHIWKTEVTTKYMKEKRAIGYSGEKDYSYYSILREGYCTLAEKRCKLELFKLIIASFNRNAQANSITFKTPCNK